MRIVHLWTVEPTAIEHPDAAALLRQYFVDIVGRYHRRAATVGEVDAAMADEPSDDLAVFLLARHGAAAAGCIGVRRLDATTTELTRMFVCPDFRGQGTGARLIGAAEHAARELGATHMRLDTRHDLVEARRLYARCGYREIPAYNSGPYADHWFEKPLVSGKPR